MLPKRDRERLERIEQELRVEDPEFTSRFHRTQQRSPARIWCTPGRLLGVITTVAALLCLVLGQGFEFSVAAMVAATLFAFHDWTFRSD